MDLREIGKEVEDFMHLVQRDKWWALLNTVSNLHTVYRVANFLTT
jgi:hypothetical protein